MWTRVTLKGTLTPSHPRRLLSLLLVGDVLVSLCNQGKLRVWDAQRLVMTTEVEVEVDARMGGAVVLHPDTYINKVGCQEWSVCVSVGSCHQI